MEPQTALHGWWRWLYAEPTTWPLRRLFWSGDLPQPDDAADPAWVAAVLTTILEEGNAADWRLIRWDSVWPIWDKLPISPTYRPFWELYRKEEDAMNRREQVLDAEQHQILRLASGVLPSYGFELAGGTALAAGYLGHRLSQDLDLFAPPMGQPQWTEAVNAVLTVWTTAGLSAQRDSAAPSSGFVRLWVGQRPVKIELAQDSPYRLAPSDRQVDGMPVRSLKDLAADKTLALFDRATTRDFVDVYLLLQHYELSQLMAWAQQKDSGFDRDWFIRALMHAEKVQPHRVTVLVPLDWDHLRLTFRQAALRLEREAREAKQENDR